MEIGYYHSVVNNEYYQHSSELFMQVFVKENVSLNVRDYGILYLC